MLLEPSVSPQVADRVVPTQTNPLSIEENPMTATDATCEAAAITP